jgi:hypothetical protein
VWKIRSLATVERVTTVPDQSTTIFPDPGESGFFRRGFAVSRREWKKICAPFGSQVNDRSEVTQNLVAGPAGQPLPGWQPTLDPQTAPACCRAEHAHPRGGFSGIYQPTRRQPASTAHSDSEPLATASPHSTAVDGDTIVSQE